MRLEPVARVGSTGEASSAVPRFVRTGVFLGASVVLHGVLAVLFLRGLPVRPVAPPAAVRPAVDVEVLWREGSGARADSGLASAPGLPRAAPPAAPEPVKPTRLPAVSAPTVRKVAPPPAAPEHASAPTRSEVAASVAALAEEARAKAEAARAEFAAQAEKRADVAGLPRAEVADSAGPSRVEPGASGGGETSGLGVAGASASSGGGAGARGGGSGVSGGGGAVDLSAYGERLSSLFSRQRRYPASAVRLRMEGTAVVLVRVRKDGTLAAPPQLVSSSRYGVLDAEALHIVEASAPFAPLPEGYSRPSAEFTVPIRFSLH